MWLALLAGCGVGLDLSDPATDEVVDPLDGHTWSVDLHEVTYVEPEGLGDLMALIEADKLLFHVVDETNYVLEMVVSLANATGRQDPCERVVSLPPATWNDPEFTIADARYDLTIGGTPVTISHSWLSGTVSPDGEEWTDAALTGMIDARQLGDALGDVDVCEVLAGMGSECVACDDGEVACFDMQVQAIHSQTIGGEFDPTPDTSGC